MILISRSHQFPAQHMQTPYQTFPYPAQKPQFVPFNSTSHAKPQCSRYQPFFQNMSPHIIPQNNISSSNINSNVNDDTYSGFFSGSSLSQSELDESVLLTREETKVISKMRVGECAGDCSICFESYNKGQIIRNLPCGHKFHYKCMKPWLKTSSLCPLCRFDLKTFCRNKVEERELIKMQECCKSEENLQDKMSSCESQNFTETNSIRQEKAFLNEEIAISEIEMNKSMNENFLRNEEELRYRVMGFETESNVSFFGKRESKEDINFGIEDHISEIGF